MIISASIRTDIPAFYGEWFMNRLDAGFCLVRNPYSPRPYHADLRREAVDAFAFWTKNIGPFMDRLAEVHRRGYPFIVQYTINGLPRELESAVIDSARSVDFVRRLAETYGPRVVVWRYDPILFTSLTPPDFHRATFARLADSLAGTVDEVSVAFANIYQKTRRNLDVAARRYGLTWADSTEDQRADLLRDLHRIAGDHGIRLTVCSQPTYDVPGVAMARCVDVERISDVAGETIGARLKGNRPGCGCYYSRDIGAYDTCPHGCVYCYAVRNRAAARRNFRAHDPHSIYLDVPGITGEPEPESGPRQLRLV